MDLIYAYVWIWIGAAGLLGFAAAWGLQGLIAGGRRQDAEMQRDVALSEMNQLHGELDSLYATQRRQKDALARAARANLEDLRERDGRLSALTEDLRAAREELRDLRQSWPQERAGPDNADAIADLKARNTYLEERVSDVEGKVHSLAEDVFARPVADTKRAWQVGYLKTRVAALEDKLVGAEKTSPPSSEPANPVLRDSLDEDLARLRWRNRYLEGRLAYFEEAYSLEASEPPAPLQPVPDVMSKRPDATAASEAGSSLEAAEWRDTKSETVEEEPEASIQEDMHPSDIFLEVLDGLEERIDNVSGDYSGGAGT